MAILSIDASRTTVVQHTGTEIYALALIRAMLKLHTPYHFRLYFRDQPPLNLLPENRLIEHRVINIPWLWSHVGLAWELARHPPDGLFIPSHIRPVFCRARTVVTVHDLGYLHFPHSHPWWQRTYLDLATRYSARRAEHVIADSHATRADLIENYHIKPDKITVIYPGFDPTPFDNARRTTSRSDLPNTYLLHVGTLHPRKNLLRLLEAMDVLKDHPSKPVLVCAGKRGWLSASITEQVKHLKLQAHVRFLDYVEQSELPSLYAHATAYVAPSLYEGFGFTPLEAMASGTPVVSSDGGSLPEVVGDAALVFPAHDTDALVNSIRRLLPGGDEELRSTLITKGHDQIRQFTWGHAASQTLDVLEKAFRVKGEAQNVKNTKRSQRPEILTVLSIPVYDITFAETLAWIEQAIASIDNHQVCTVNPEFVMMAQKNAKFRQVLQTADLCLPDGQGLLWAARLRGASLRQRVPGSTLLWRLAERASTKGWKLYLLGASEGVAARTGEILQSHFPGLQIVGTHSGSPRPDRAPEIIERVRAAKPDVLLVAYGAPQQDLWIDCYRAQLDIAVMMGVGGSFDFVTGVAHRAPEWLQGLGLEWLYRLIRQPWRWARMLTLPQFAWETLTRRNAIQKQVTLD